MKELCMSISTTETDIHSNSFIRNSVVLPLLWLLFLPCKVLICSALFAKSLSFSAILLLLSSLSLSIFWLTVFNSSLGLKCEQKKSETDSNYNFISDDWNSVLLSGLC